MTLIAFLVVGLTVGLAPSAMKLNLPMGFVGVTGLAVGGAFVGGFLGCLANAPGTYLAIGPAGLAGSIIGALAAMALASFGTAHQGNVGKPPSLKRFS